MAVPDGRPVGHDERRFLNSATPNPGPGSTKQRGSPYPVSRYPPQAAKQTRPGFVYFFFFTPNPRAQWKRDRPISPQKYVCSWSRPDCPRGVGFWLSDAPEKAAYGMARTRCLLCRLRFRRRPTAGVPFAAARTLGPPGKLRAPQPDGRSHAIDFRAKRVPPALKDAKLDSLNSI